MSLLIKESVYVELGIAEYPVPADGSMCTTDNHDACDWKEVLKTGLEQLFPEIEITDPESKNNVIRFTVSYSNRSAQKADILNKLDVFFNYYPMMAVKFVHLTQKESV